MEEEEASQKKKSYQSIITFLLSIPGKSLGGRKLVVVAKEGFWNFLLQARLAGRKEPWPLTHTLSLSLSPRHTSIDDLNVKVHEIMSRDLPIMKRAGTL